MTDVDVAERDRVIAEAVEEGKFSEARAQVWRDEWDKNPKGTRAVIGRLAAVLIPGEIEAPADAQTALARVRQGLGIEVSR
jgi:hypothetical protein